MSCTRKHQNGRNPFMTTTSSMVGIKLHEPVVFAVPTLEENQKKDSALDCNSNSNASFMFQTSNQAIGQGVVHTSSSMSTQMDKIIATKEIEKNSIYKLRREPVVQPQDILMNGMEFQSTQVKTEIFNDNRNQNPLYATSNSIIGAQQPQSTDIAPCSTEGTLRKPISFTNSFNGFRYRDYGLNTSITKSRVSDQIQ